MSHGASTHPFRASMALTLSLLLSACPEPEPQEPQRCAASEVRCTEQSIDKLSLLTVVSTGELREEGTTSGEFLTFVDATAGGSSPKQSYTYARFTPQGLTRVELDDQAALTSTEWDIAFRRYIIRVNSGVSGASCTSVAQTPEGTTFASVTSVNSAWEFRTEDYFTEACALLTDDSGIGAPAGQLATYWSYQGCLAMTNKVFVVRLADGRHVKLQVMSYYDDAAVQRACDTGVGFTPAGSAKFRVKWAFLP